ncbi:putative Ig domain-containing protein [Streptomyces sp. NPDC058086]|uniref:putative Ig domain-containing protein n=1 Tax=Streptomyces sp. NPDC058086 TaxID=3346334 RepID=UPI0036ED5BF6
MPSSLAYSAAGLPTGLSIAPVTGLIPGTPTTAGAFTPAVSIENSASRAAPPASSSSPPATWTAGA